MASRIANEINGLMLAHAFVIVKSAGYKLRINKTDGVPKQGSSVEDSGTTIVVDIVGGFVRKSWASE